MNRVVFGEIYTAGKNFTLPPAVTALTNFTSGDEQTNEQPCDHIASLLLTSDKAFFFAKKKHHVDRFPF